MLTGDEPIWDLHNVETIPYPKRVAFLSDYALQTSIGTPSNFRIKYYGVVKRYFIKVHASFKQPFIKC